MPAATEGAVQVPPARTRLQSGDHLREEHRLVAGCRAQGRIGNGSRHDRHNPGQASRPRRRTVRAEEYAPPSLCWEKYAPGSDVPGEKHGTMPYATTDGLRIQYEVTGNGEPLVLYHGLTGSGERWRDTGYVTGLADAYRLILIDARGHGGSDKPHVQVAYGRRR